MDNLMDFEPNKRNPKAKEWINLGQDYGISITVWDNGVTVEKRKKSEKKTEDGKNIWDSTEKINFSNTVLKELFVRIPEYYRLTKKGG